MRRRGNFIGTRVEGNSTFKKVFGLQEIMKRRNGSDGFDEEAIA